MKTTERIITLLVIAAVIALTAMACQSAEVPVTVQKSGTNVVITLPAAAYDGAFDVLGTTNNAQKAEAIKRITRSGIRQVEQSARAKVEQRLRAADMNKLKTISDATK